MRQGALPKAETPCRVAATLWGLGERVSANSTRPRAEHGETPVLFGGISVNTFREHYGGSPMSLRNFHVNGNVTDEELLSRSSGFVKNFVASFRQAAANGNFSFGPIQLKDADLNRVHSIVTEIDSRRVFFACGEDEVPRYAMRSLYEVRDSIREHTKGVWANPTCEILVQEISHTLSEACTAAEKLGGEHVHMGSREFESFIDIITDMRLKIWALVAALKNKLGSVINPRNMPPEINAQVKKHDI